MSESDVVVIGAGPTGLTTALLLARAGCRVTVLDRDAEPPPAGGDAWNDWQRPGVNQLHQPHVALPRWHRVMSEELPEVVAELEASGGARVNLLHQHPTAVTGGWQAGDERFETVTARRPVLEAAVATVAEREPGIRALRGRRATGLRVAPPRVIGVDTDDGPLRAALVVDATGHRSPVPRWLAGHGRAPAQWRSAVGLTYYARHLRGRTGAPRGAGGALTHHESYAVLALPADDRTWALAVIVCSADRAARGLGDEAAWEAALRSSGLDERWFDGEPLGPVRPLAGLADQIRDYAPGGEPVLDGLVAVGDAWATTSPFLGRGLSLGALSAVALRDAVVAAGPLDGGMISRRHAALLAERVLPYVRSTIDFGRHRLAEMTAQAGGGTYRPEDPSWLGSSALTAGARSDPLLLRAHSMIASLLATPAEVVADPEIRARIGPWLGSPLCPPDLPGRAALLAALTSTTTAATRAVVSGAGIPGSSESTDVRGALT